MIASRVLLSVVAMGFVVATAKAEPQAKPAPNAAYEEARVLYAKGDFAGSLAALARGQKDSPDPRFFWNMAACEKKLGHHAKAIGYVERYLSSAADVLTDEEKRNAAQFLTAARAYVGSVIVLSNVEGVQVFVDGELVGTTPLSRPLVVDQGERGVRFVRSGYASVTRTETILGGSETRWAVELEPTRPSPSLRIAGPNRVAPAALGLGGLVVVGAGAVFTAIALGEASAIEKECGTSCPPSRWEPYRTLQTSGNIMAGVGSAALVTAVVWWILQPNRSLPDAHHAGVAATVGGASVGWSF